MIENKKHVQRRAINGKTLKILMVFCKQSFKLVKKLIVLSLN